MHSTRVSTAARWQSSARALTVQAMENRVRRSESHCWEETKQRAAADYEHEVIVVWNSVALVPVNILRRCCLVL